MPDRARAHRSVLVGDHQVVGGVAAVRSDVEDRPDPAVGGFDDLLVQQRIEPDGRQRRSHGVGGFGGTQ